MQKAQGENEKKPYTKALLFNSEAVIPVLPKIPDVPPVRFGVVQFNPKSPHTNRVTKPIAIHSRSNTDRGGNNNIRRVNTDNSHANEQFIYSKPTENPDSTKVQVHYLKSHKRNESPTGTPIKQRVGQLEEISSKEEGSLKDSPRRNVSKDISLEEFQSDDLDNEGILDKLDSERELDRGSAAFVDFLSELSTYSQPQFPRIREESSSIENEKYYPLWIFPFKSKTPQIQLHNWKLYTYTILDSDNTKITCYTDKVIIPELTIDLTKLTSVMEIAENSHHTDVNGKYVWTITNIKLLFACNTPEERSWWITFVQSNLLRVKHNTNLENTLKLQVRSQDRYRRLSIVQAVNTEGESSSSSQGKHNISQNLHDISSEEKISPPKLTQRSDGMININQSHSLLSNSRKLGGSLRQKRRALAFDQYGFQENLYTPNNIEGVEIQNITKLKKRREDIRWDDLVNTYQGDYTRVKRCKLLKSLIRLHGIPRHLRGIIWPRITTSFANLLAQPHAYEDYLRKNQSEPNPYQKQIEADLPRTFPTNVQFNSDFVQGSLGRILNAFALLQPTIGYCQAMNFLAAMLLFFMEENLAFWMLAETITILPPQYYSKHLLGVKADVNVFKNLINMKLPKLGKHFSSLNVDIGVYVTQWFMCLYINYLPVQTAMRFLDSLFYDGSVMLFRVGLALLGLNQKVLLKISSNEELMMFCRKLPLTISDSNILFDQAYTQFKISRQKLKEWRQQALIAAEQRWREKHLRTDKIGSETG
jgi:hypothetical protein